MEKVRLGKTDMMVSKLGLGGIPIQRLREDEAVAVVKRCLDLGINFIDTANAYTNSEERIGKAISGRREELILATKSQARDHDGIANHLQQSLKRLRVESIDLYQFHGVNDFKALDMVLDPKGPMRVIKKAQRERQVKHIGITSHQIDVAREAVKSGYFETVMFPFNFIACEADNEIISLAKHHDVGFIGMKPLAGGMLDNVSVAIKYLLQFPDVVPIVGIQMIHEINDIIEVLNGPREMTDVEKREMERLREELGTRFCRRCDYCQPCTEKIPISSVMIFPSLMKRLPAQNLFSGTWASAMEKGVDCTECGECEERCPFHLPIREMIKDNIKLYREQKHKYQKEISTKIH